jgi:hypothetical protein
MTILNWGTMTINITFEDSDSGRLNIEFSGSIESLHLFAYLKEHSKSKGALEEAFMEALKLGGHALNLDTTSVLISEIERNLEGRLSAIRQIYENRKAILKQSHAVGKLAEKTFEEALKEFSIELGFGDTIRATGDNSQDGKVRGIGDRKLGDLEILIKGSELKIAIESKYSGSSTALGDTALGGNYSNLSIESHARGQVRGAQANREAHYAIFITKPGSSVAKSMKSNLLVDHNDMAIYVVADMETGNFENLKFAYMLARALTLTLDWPTVQQHHLRSVAALLIRSANKLAKYAAQLEAIKKLGTNVISTAQELISDFEDDKKAIETSMDYLTTVNSSMNSDALSLKVKEIELLSGLKLEIKEPSI